MEKYTWFKMWGLIAVQTLISGLLCAGLGAEWMAFGMFILCGYTTRQAYTSYKLEM